MKRHLLVAGLLAVAGSINLNTASADIYNTGDIFYKEDFQSFSAGVNPTSTNVTWNGIGQTSLTRTAVDPTNASNMTLRMNIPEGNVNATGYTVVFGESAPTAGQVSFRLYITSLGTGSISLFHALNTASGNLDDQHTDFKLLASNGNANYIFNGNAANPYQYNTGITVLTGQWLDCVIDYDITQTGPGTMSLIIGNSGPVSINTAGAGVSPAEFLRFGFYELGNAANTTIYIDDITIPVPEPASLGLMAIGGALLMTRRRK